MITRRSAVAALAGQARPRRPNLLFIIADDHAGYVLGCAGNRQARTPNLDRLAADGARFARHFANSPVCTPSRQSLLNLGARAIDVAQTAAVAVTIEPTEGSEAPTSTPFIVVSL